MKQRTGLGDAAVFHFPLFLQRITQSRTQLLHGIHHLVIFPDPRTAEGLLQFSAGQAERGILQNGKPSAENLHISMGHKPQAHDKNSSPKDKIPFFNIWNQLSSFRINQLHLILELKNSLFSFPFRFYMIISTGIFSGFPIFLRGGLFLIVHIGFRQLSVFPYGIAA